MAEGSKTFINNTGKNINITMFIRAGDSPADEGGTQVVSVRANEQVKAIYVGHSGSLGYVYLNALLVEWEEDPDIIGVSKRVVARGDTWDTILNENDTVTIFALAGGTLNASGSNTR